MLSLHVFINPAVSPLFRSPNLKKLQKVSVKGKEVIVKVKAKSNKKVLKLATHLKNVCTGGRKVSSLTSAGVA